MIEDTKIEKRLGCQLNCVKAVSKIGIYLSFLDGTEEPNISNKPTIILPESVPPIEIRISLQLKGLPNRNLNIGIVTITPIA